ncbi:MAG: hypothetical protein IT353_15095 [Gemmatimonadaceae bacterium]|nr:hypothetical protein [Gemmatimonadaceae bacterium]
MSRQSSNWVDRGDPLEASLARVLGAALGLRADDPRLLDHALVIRGQVEAAATEGEIATYARSLFPVYAREPLDLATDRLLGTALWHIAKVGLNRDAARSAHA